MRNPPLGGAISPIAPVIVANPYSAPGIQKGDAGSREIRDVPGDKSECMNFSCSCEEGIHHADGFACGGTPAHHATPSVSDGCFNDE